MGSFRRLIRGRQRRRPSSISRSPYPPIIIVKRTRVFPLRPLPVRMGITWPLLLVCWAGLWDPPSDQWSAKSGVRAPPWAPNPDPAYTFPPGITADGPNATKEEVLEYIEAIQHMTMNAKDEQEQVFQARGAHVRFVRARNAYKTWAKIVMASPQWQVLPTVVKVLENLKCSLFDVYRQSGQRQVSTYIVRHGHADDASSYRRWMLPHGQTLLRTSSTRSSATTCTGM